MRKRNDTLRQLIIHGAHRQFLAAGYTATTVDAIAAEAGITKRTLYGYFSTKRALFLEVIRQAVGDPLDATFFHKQPETTQDVADTLRTIAAGLNDITTRPDYVQLLRIAIAEIPFQPDVGVLFEQSMAHQSLSLLKDFLADADKRGLIIAPHPETVAGAFAGSFIIRMLLHGLLQAPDSVNLKPLSSHEIDALVDTFIGTVRNNA